MRLRKIISGGQTGADQGAVEAAIAYGFPYGGWVPKGRLPQADKLKEMPTDSCKKCNRQNVLDADGTVIISRGRLAGGFRDTLAFAGKLNKPCLHVDLNVSPVYLAASDIYRWTLENRISRLHVAGPSASKDPGIHEDVRYIIEGLILLTLAKAPAHGELADLSEGELIERIPSIRKQSVVNAVVEDLISDIPLDGRVTIANMSEDEITVLQAVFEEYVKNQMDGTGDAEVDDVMRVLWERLKRTHKLRIVK